MSKLSLELQVMFRISVFLAPPSHSKQFSLQRHTLTTHTHMHILKTAWLKYFLQQISSNLHHALTHILTSSPRGELRKVHKDETKFRTRRRKYTHTHTHYICVCVFFFFFFKPGTQTSSFSPSKSKIHKVQTKLSEHVDVIPKWCCGCLCVGELEWRTPWLACTHT